jgi:hypothetical protein
LQGGFTGGRELSDKKYGWRSKKPAKAGENDRKTSALKVCGEG